jgi:PBP1b-binding outer membrane lipoprotein LpoB
MISFGPWLKLVSGMITDRKTQRRNERNNLLGLIMAYSSFGRDLMLLFSRRVPTHPKGSWNFIAKLKA